MIIEFYVHIDSKVLWPGSCTCELQLKVNCRPKLNCSIKFGLARPTVVNWQTSQIFFYIHFQSKIQLQLQFTCTWSGPMQYIYRFFFVCVSYYVCIYEIDVSQWQSRTVSHYAFSFTNLKRKWPSFQNRTAHHHPKIYNVSTIKCQMYT